MALCDWDDDGNNDLLDDYIEYQIYKDVTSEFDSDTNTYRSYPKPKKKGVLKQAMENVSKANSVCGSVVIPDTPEFDALRLKYSDYEIKVMVSLLYRNTKEVREVLYSKIEDPDHRAMRRLVMGLGVLLPYLETGFIIYEWYCLATDRLSGFGCLLMIVMVIVSFAAMIKLMKKCLVKADKMLHENKFDDKYKELYEVVRNTDLGEFE